MPPKRKEIETSQADQGRPLKKRSVTTAGRGAEGESSAITNGRTSNSQSVRFSLFLPVHLWLPMKVLIAIIHENCNRFCHCAFDAAN